MSKKPVLGGNFDFPVSPEVDLLHFNFLILTTIQVYMPLKSLKHQLDSELFVKNLFDGHFELSQQNRKLNSKVVIFQYSLRSNNKICRYNFENVLIGSRVIIKTPVSDVHFGVSRKNRK